MLQKVFASWYSVMFECMKCYCCAVEVIITEVARFYYVLTCNCQKQAQNIEQKLTVNQQQHLQYGVKRPTPLKVIITCLHQSVWGLSQKFLAVTYVA